MLSGSILYELCTQYMLFQGSSTVWLHTAIFGTRKRLVHSFFEHGHVAYQIDGNDE